MGSFIEINDTLRITKEQGFPVELDLAAHLKTPYTIDEVADKVFHFQAKPDIRIYKVPPVRNFLVEDVGGKWVYWGLCFIQSIEHDYVKKETSGTFKIVRLNTPDEMKQMFKLTQDYTFNSPSLAAAVLLGKNANGRIEWKDVQGRTLKEIQEAAAG